MCCGTVPHRYQHKDESAYNKYSLGNVFPLGPDVNISLVSPLVVLALNIGPFQHTLTNWVESCGGCCTVRGLCSDLSHE